MAGFLDDVRATFASGGELENLQQEFEKSLEKISMLIAEDSFRRIKEAIMAKARNGEFEFLPDGRKLMKNEFDFDKLSYSSYHIGYKGNTEDGKEVFLNFSKLFYKARSQGVVAKYPEFQFEEDIYGNTLKSVQLHATYVEYSEQIICEKSGFFGRKKQEIQAQRQGCFFGKYGSVYAKTLKKLAAAEGMEVMFTCFYSDGDFAKDYSICETLPPMNQIKGKIYWNMKVQTTYSAII